MMASPSARTAVVELSNRLHKCWSQDLNWDLYTDDLKIGCHQVGKAISMAPSAVLAGLILIVSFSLSHSVVSVEGTDWVEPVIIWLSICMPTGMGKSSLCKYLRSLVKEAKKRKGLDDVTSWLCDDQSFEKMGDLMFHNHWKLLGLYDELPMFLSQVNIFRGRGLSDSHELAVFLQLYGAEQWVRKTVSGEANFSMTHTGLTVGGFIQPTVARNMIEVQGNIEKGLCQRFLWLFPKPTAVQFSELEKVNETFSNSVAALMSELWVSDHTVREWKLEKPCTIFQEKYDDVQKKILDISCMDDLLSGMLSKSRGQILRVAATFHVLFHLDTPTSIPTNISDDAMKAAVDFVEVCTQHVAYIAGRGVISEAIKELQEVQKGSKKLCAPSQAHSNAAYSLSIPGKTLNLHALTELRKFKGRGNKPGAIEAWRLLHEAGLGVLVETKARRGTDMLYEFKKAPIPQEEEEKVAFIETLQSFGVSLKAYKSAMANSNLTVSKGQSSSTPKKGKSSTPNKNKEEADSDTGSTPTKRSNDSRSPSGASRKILKL